MAFSCLSHYLKCSYISLRPLRYFMNVQKCLQFSTSEKISAKNYIPVKYTTSKGAEVSIKETIYPRRNFRKYAPKYEKCLETQCYKRQFATRNVKVYKFLPAPNKNLSASKESKLPPSAKIDKGTVELLERISLIGIENERGIEILEEAIRFADQIFDVDTTKVKPLVTVLEDESVYLREDEPKIDATRDEIIFHSEVTLENYFITPLGNLDYIPQEKSFELSNLEKICKN